MDTEQRLRDYLKRAGADLRRARLRLQEVEEAARLARNAGQDQKLSPTPFLVKAVAGTLQRLPRFNAAFDAAGGQLVLRDYVNVGLAIDTPGGLVIVSTASDKRSSTGAICCNSRSPSELSATAWCRRSNSGLPMNRSSA